LYIAVAGVAGQTLAKDDSGALAVVSRRG
jgi:hypothetical protein